MTVLDTDWVWDDFAGKFVRVIPNTPKPKFFRAEPEAKGCNCPKQDMTCGACGRTWNDLKHPTHGPRCPWEHLHEEDDEPDYEEQLLSRQRDPEDVIASMERQYEKWLGY